MRKAPPQYKTEIVLMKQYSNFKKQAAVNREKAD